MADKNIQMTQRNPGNTAWDNLYPITKNSNIIYSPTVWTNLTLQNGTTVFSSRIPMFAKVGNEVIVEGEIVATGGGIVIATLPVGFRPPTLRSFKVSQNWSASNDGATIYVNTDGTMTLQVAGSYAQSISLMNIRFQL